MTTFPELDEQNENEKKKIKQNERKQMKIYSLICDIKNI